MSRQHSTTQIDDLLDRMDHLPRRRCTVDGCVHVSEAVRALTQELGRHGWSVGDRVTVASCVQGLFVESDATPSSSEARMRVTQRYVEIVADDSGRTSPAVGPGKRLPLRSDGSILALVMTRPL